MLSRVLEPEVMDTVEEAVAYDTMDHAAVNRVFAADFLGVWDGRLPVLDVGTGTAQIPIELCRQHPTIALTGVDLAKEMLRVGRENVRRAGLEERIRLERVDAKGMPYPDGAFAAVISNSIVHHVPEPRRVFAEMARLTASGGTLFIRDLLRPPDTAELERLVGLYAADADDQQRQLFADSLHAALTVDEVRALVAELGFDRAGVRQTTDRHWTLVTRK